MGALRCGAAVVEVLMSFQGKKVLITGSSRGIGRGIALKLAEKGARVAVHYYRNREAAEETLGKIRKLGSDGFLVQADVCRAEEVRRIFEQVRSEFGSLDIFVSNARTETATFYEAPMDSTLDKWDTAMVSQSPSRRAGDLEAGSHGWRWARLTQPWKCWCDISRWRWPAAGLP